MVDMINQERVAAGLSPVKVDLRLASVGRAKAIDMKVNNYFSHTSPVLGSFDNPIRKYAPDYRTMGENLAGNQSVQAAMTAFMNSSGHKANIL
ncbi:MAG: hypothetical protein K6T68_14185, partial [Alicyclobacillus shizuokensis]|nr:hypothetical protein [Alicyclobacillus shizuokensis]